MQLQDNESFITNIRDIPFKVDEENLGEILHVRRSGIRTMVNKSPTKGFLEEASKFKTLNPAAICKKLLKGQYQLYFEFVNKALLPRAEKRTVATMADLYLMEKLCTMV